MNDFKPGLYYISQETKDRQEALERENASLKAQADENEEQIDGYRRLCDGLSELVADIGAGDGFYGNDPVELLGNVMNKFDDLKTQLAESERKRERLKSHIKENKRLIKMTEAREEYAWEKIAELREAVDKQATEWEKRAVHYSFVSSTLEECVMECIYRKCASALRAKLKEVA